MMNLTTNQDLLDKLVSLGVKEVQLHEPALVMWDANDSLSDMFSTAYSASKARWYD